MDPQNNTLIGYITRVQSNGFFASITLNDKGNFPITLIEGKPILAGQIGSYLTIHQGNIRILARIIRASNTPDIKQQRNDTDDHKAQTGWLELIPLGELTAQTFHRGIRRFPTPGAKVHIITQNELNLLFSSFTGKSIELGHLPAQPSVNVSLDAAALFGRHSAILGQSGSGKSWGVANLLQQAVSTMPNAHVVLLDLHGEYHWIDGKGAAHSAFDEDITQCLDARTLEIPFWLLTFAELVDLFIDRTEDGASTQIAFFREVIHSLRRKANPEIESSKISIDTPVYFSLTDLYRHIKAANEQNLNFGKQKGALHGKFDGLLMRMQSRLNDVRYDFLFKPKHRTDSASLAGLLRDLVGLGQKKSQITIIDLSSVPFDVRPTVSAQIGRLVFEFNYWNPNHSQFPILLVCEEAHTYIPREEKTTFAGTRQSIERIAKEGRKYGLSLAVVSQRPHELSETVLAQCANFLCFRITNPDDQAYIRSLVPDGETNLVDTLAALGRGEVMALGEAVPIPLRFQMYPPDPKPNSSDTDLYTYWKSEPKDIDVESIAQNWQNQLQQTQKRVNVSVVSK
ncbi:ATP-binding protein [Pseudomonadota bacterium]